MESGQAELLTQNQIDEKIDIVNATGPGALAPLPSLPEQWILSDELWQKINEEPFIARTAVRSINDWVRQGLELHRAGEACQFCDGTVTAQRINDLEKAIGEAEFNAPDLVKEQLQRCKSTLKSVRGFETSLKAINLSTSLYISRLPEKQAEVLKETQSVLNQLEAAEALLAKRITNPLASIEETRPNVDFSYLEDKFIDLENAHTTALNQIRGHSDNINKAIDDLKRHCCARDGSAWEATRERYEDSEKEVVNAENAVKTLERKLLDLKRQISTTQHTADFLNDSLHLVLGEKTLRISEGEPGEGYRITRYDQKAVGMSEGEKKLVSLLYFCAEFLSEERRQSLKNSVIIFDDLGSELDEARLLAIDRFITDHFKNSKNPQPASLVYFTHSHTYLKILQNRLAEKAVPRNRTDPRKAKFYEVYKDRFNSTGKSTRCRPWDDEAVRLTNEYWLSFYMLLKAFRRLQNNEAPDFSTGNYCRKVLEGFTEFRAPGDGKFGVRLNTLISATNAPISPALSKIVNGLSHLELGNTGGVLSRSEIEAAIIQTLNFLRMVDNGHFRALSRNFMDEKGAKEFEGALKSYSEPDGRVFNGA